MAIQAPAELELDYRVMREGAGELDGRRAMIDVAGPDAVDFLQGQVTNDVAALEPGRGCYALLLNPKGRILADLRILMRNPEELWLDTDPTVREAVISGLSRYTIGRAVEVKDRTGDRSIVSLVGPRSGAIAGVDALDEEHRFATAEIEGAQTLVVKSDLGVDVIFDSGEAAVIEPALAERGSKSVSPEAAEVLRIESGRPRHGVDMTEDNFPGELGLEERAVSFTKGCYVGQEPVARMHHRGHPNRHLRGLRLRAPAVQGQALVRDGKQVGTVTSACVSPVLGPIALALVRREVESGSSVEAGEPGSSATVVELPFELHDQ